MPKLTKRLVDGLRPTGRDFVVWDSGDGSLKGLGVRMSGSGAGSWVIQYRNQEGRSRRLTLGRVGVLTSEQARELAADKLREVAHGGDPAAERKAARKAMTVGELCDWWLRDAKPRIKASSWKMDQSRIERHVKPLLGDRKVARLTVSDVSKFQADVAAGKTAKKRPPKGRTGETRGGPGVAGRAVGMLGTVLEMARRHEIIDRNPARGVRRLPDKKRTRYLNVEEFGRLGEAIREAEAEGRTRTGLAAIRALALTGCRRNEILSLTWEEFDEQARCVRFKDTKSGEQIRPLGLAAVRCIAAQPRRDGCPWVFPADRASDGHFVAIRGVMLDVCARAGLEDVTPHTLRHSFASVAAELGFSELVIAGLLGHAARGITQRYAHSPDTALLAAADRVAARIEAALDGERPGEVVPLLRAAE